MARRICINRKRSLMGLRHREANHLVLAEHFGDVVDREDAGDRG